MRVRRFSPMLLSLLLAVSIVFGALPAMADGTPTIGTLVVTNRNTTNVRSGPDTSYPIVGKVSPGDYYEVISQAPSGWYQITLDDGTVGYISDKMVAFTPGPGVARPVTDVTQVRATITVSYRTDQGQTLATDYITLAYGTNIVSANDTKVPAGYTLTSSRRVTVSVSAQGTASPSAVVYTYRAGGASSGQVQLPVYYKDVYGALLNTGYVYLAPGSSLITPNSSLVPAGYSLVGPRDVVVSVSSYLAPNPASVTFLYTRAAATPAPVATAMMPVFYRTTAGAFLNTAYISLQTGTHNVAYNPALIPAGYSLVSAGNTVVTVDANGLATPSSVTFLLAQYVTPAPVTPAPVRQAVVGVYYRSVAGDQLNAQNITLVQGTHNLSANDSLVPAGYVLASARSQAVTVDYNGVAYPSSIVFLYNAPAPGTGTAVPVSYKDQSGNEIARTTIYLAASGNVTANDAMVPGYTLTSPRQVWVNINEKGHASPYQVNFSYRGSGAAPQPQPQPQPQPGNAGYIPSHVQTSANPGSYAVYTGPGDWYYRVGNATLGGGSIRVYGQENGWALIGYGTSNGGYHIGFVSMAAIPASVVPPTLNLVRQPKNSVSNSIFVDDPIISKNRVLEKRIPGGSPYTFLAYFNDFWAYVEIDNFEGSGKPARGFVSRRSLGV